MIYPYTTANNLYDRQSYSYSNCDEEFFSSYLLSRETILKKYGGEAFENTSQVICCVQTLDSGSIEEMKFDGTCLNERMKRVIFAGYGDDFTGDDFAEAEKIVKTFEVRKRLYHYYDDRMKPLDESDFEDRSLYVLFGCMVLILYKKTGNLKYLNALLKVNDILISLKDELVADDILRQLFIYLLSGETTCIAELMKGTKNEDSK